MDRKKLVVSLLVGAAVFLVAGAAFAQSDNSMIQMATLDRGKWAAIAAGLGIGIAAFGGALGQGRAAASALDGIARNPGASDKMFTPMIISLALIESLVIYALIIAFLLIGKV